MIARDQPTIFPDNVTVRVSDASDGTMTLKSLPENPEVVWQNRKDFITTCGGDLGKTALVYVTYDDTRSYAEYKLAETVGTELSTTEDDVADGLATQGTEVGLFLPVADCCATVLYDQKRRALMVSHLGRHSVEIFGAKKSFEFMRAEFGTESCDVLAWLGPAVGGENYPIVKRDNRSIKKLIERDLLEAGVKQGNIEISQVDTDRDINYFSHSEYRKGNRASDGRFAVYAQIIN